ncbi:MAG: 3-hydroxybutyryl-CoA dehydrogenase [Bacteroidetes bacterium]|nr:3-hydroxybutyryl-CoA dehydrogenase [Bacteroidota bacterium]
MSTVAVIGGGTMGNGIAHVFAQNGFTLNLIETKQEFLTRAIATITKNLNRMVSKEKISQDEMDATFGRIKGFLSIEEGVVNADLVVEAVNENLELKKSIFQKLDELTKPETILASNTSSISITKIAGFTKRPKQVIGMHFFNPVPMMKLVEVVRGLETSDEVTELIMKTSKKLGKTPVEVNDFPGFVSNRVLMPMINEAIFAVYEGVATPQAVDDVMKMGMAHPMGPLRLADFIGLDVCLAILNVLYDGFKDSKYRPCPLLVKMVDAGKLGDKSGQGFYSYSK